MIHRMLRPGLSLERLLTMAVEFMQGTKMAEDIKLRFENGVSLPKKTILYKASDRLVKLDFLYERELHNEWSFARHWSPDSSPQGRYNFFPTVEGRRRWKTTSSLEERLINRSPLETRQLTVVTMGYGAGGLLYKAAGEHHQAALESGTWNKFVKLRHEVKTYTSDASTEQDVRDAPCLYAENFENVQTIAEEIRAGTLKPPTRGVYFLPLALFVYDVYKCFSMH